MYALLHMYFVIRDRLNVSQYSRNNISSICNTGTSALPDLDVLNPVARGLWAYISQVPVLRLSYMLHFQHSKICPKLDVDISVCLYSNK